MAPARLTGNLLARKGPARPTGRHRMATAVMPRAMSAPGPAPGPGRPDNDERVRLTVRIDRAMHTRLRMLGARQRRTNQDIVRCALDAYLELLDGGWARIGASKPKR